MKYYFTVLFFEFLYKQKIKIFSFYFKKKTNKKT